MSSKLNPNSDITSIENFRYLDLAAFSSIQRSRCLLSFSFISELPIQRSRCLLSFSFVRQIAIADTLPIFTSDFPIFIYEQKLYTRAQLNQHIKTGDADVDGSESERGGFTGHPLCELCRTPFYGDNELYSHMSTEYYTCHICQREHPGQYEYYKNYDDLEMHFRRDHFLCEDEACLAKKFIVFQSESEIKRHNTIEHGGRMSRSKRNVALQIPTSFRFKSNNNAQEHRRGRGRTFHRERSDYQLSMAIQATVNWHCSCYGCHVPW